MGLNHAIVVGGASGIGLAVARRFLADGTNTTIVDLSAATIDGAVRELSRGGATVRGLVADVRRAAEIEAAFAQSVAQHGALNALVVTAGVLKPALLTDMPEADYDLTFDVNTKGFWRCVKAALPHMAAGNASMVAISSGSGKRPKAGNGAYAASKTALEFLVRTFALELAAKQIRVNCVAPGTIETPLIADFATRPAASGYVPSPPPPLGRRCKPEDIANAVAFLCSDEASFITGETLSVDGGLTAGIPLSK